MPLYSDHISNMYYSGGPSYSSANYGYGSSVSPYGSSYSASYLNSGGNYSSHSSLGTYARTPLTSRWIMNGGRSYSPILSTISEKGTSSPIRINSPRRTPISSRNYITSSYTPRPININTADIDVSRDKYRSKVATSSTSSLVNLPPRRKSPVVERARSPALPQPDDKPDIGIDSSPGHKRSTIKRDRAVVRLHTIKRKDRDSPRKSDTFEKQENITNINDDLLKDNDDQEKPLESVKWRDKLANELTYNVKKDKKTLGTKLVEKFTLKDLEQNSPDHSSKQSPKNYAIVNDNDSDIYTKNNIGRRCSMEILAEQASLLDSLIRDENLSTTQLDLSKIGINDTPNILSKGLESSKDKKIFKKRNPLTTTKSDNSLYDRVTTKDKRDSQQLIKRRSIKKSLSGNNIRKLDCISEFPKIETSVPLNNIKDCNEIEKVKPKLKQKITSTVDISEPSTPIKFFVENITVEEKPRQQKKDIIFSSTVDSEKPVLKEKCSENTIAHRKSVKSKIKLKSHPSIDVGHVSPEPDDGNFWDKIGKRETVYLIHRKQNLDATKEKNNHALSWFPEEEETDSKKLSVNFDHEKLPQEVQTLSQIYTKEHRPHTKSPEYTSAEIIQNKDDINVISIIEESTINKGNENKDDKTFVGVFDELKNNQIEGTISHNSDIEISYQSICDKLDDLKYISEHTNDNTDIKKDIPNIPSVPICKISGNNINHKEIDVVKDSKLPSTNTKCTDEDIDIIKNIPSIPTVPICEISDNKIQNKEINVVKDSELPSADTKRTDENIDITKNIPSMPSAPVSEISDSKIQDKEINVLRDSKLPSTDAKAFKSNVSKTRRKSTDQDKNLKELKDNQYNLKKKILKHKSSEKSSKTINTSLSTKRSGKVVTGRKSCRVSNNNNSAKSENDKVLCDKCLNNERVLAEVLPVKSDREISLPQSEEKLEQNSSYSDEISSAKIGDSLQNKTALQHSEDINKDVRLTESTENIPTDTTENLNTSITNNNLKDNDIKTTSSAATNNERSEATKKPVKEKKAPMLIATPRPLQKKAPQIIRSSSSSETSDDDSSETEEESDSSEDSAEFFECENNLDGRTSTGSNDSGFDSSAPASPAGFLCVKKDCDVNCHRKCEKLTANLCGVNQRLLVEALALRTASKRGGDHASASTSNAPAQTYTNETLEQELEHSTTYGLFRKTGRFTPPARSIPRFKKYAIEDFQFIKVLGKGSFGKVMLAELRDTEYYYAVKCLKKDVVLEDDDVECTLIERKVLALGTNHPYLCHLFATFQTDSHLFFVMEYLNGGDLMFHIQQSGRFPEARARFYAAEIVSGLKFLHKRGIVYRDLKLDNILLDFDGHVRIADFGMCKLQIYLDKTADTFCGTPDYMAPEIIKGLKYSQTVDWWSFGVLLYEMLIGQSPFSGCDEDELFWSICNEMPSYPRFLSQESHSILTRLLDKDARTRLGGAECMYGDIRDQDFFRPIHWDKLERRELDAPIKPRMRHPLDTQYFDRAFTGERPRLTAVEPQVLRSMDQEPFRGFSYTNPNATDR